VDLTENDKRKRAGGKKIDATHQSKTSYERLLLRDMQGVPTCQEKEGRLRDVLKEAGEFLKIELSHLSLPAWPLKRECRVLNEQKEPENAKKKNTSESSDVVKHWPKEGRTQKSSRLKKKMKKKDKKKKKLREPRGQLEKQKINCRNRKRQPIFSI